MIFAHHGTLAGFHYNKDGLRLSTSFATNLANDDMQAPLQNLAAGWIRVSLPTHPERGHGVWQVPSRAGPASLFPVPHSNLVFSLLQASNVASFRAGQVAQLSWAAFFPSSALTTASRLFPVSAKWIYHQNGSMALTRNSQDSNLDWLWNITARMLYTSW